MTSLLKCSPGSSPWAHPLLCDGMRLALKGVAENHSGKGLTLTRGWLKADSKNAVEYPHRPTAPRYLGVNYNPTARSGMVVNFCPWCGARIRFDEDVKRSDS